MWPQRNAELKYEYFNDIVSNCAVKPPLDPYGHRAYIGKHNKKLHLRVALVRFCI